jgi:DUF971 family protein
LHYLGTEQARLWEEYLAKLAQAGHERKSSARASDDRA